jgi:hypothetical protein
MDSCVFPDLSSMSNTGHNHGIEFFRIEATDFKLSRDYLFLCCVNEYWRIQIYIICTIYHALEASKYPVPCLSLPTRALGPQALPRGLASNERVA